MGDAIGFSKHCIISPFTSQSSQSKKDCETLESLTAYMQQGEKISLYSLESACKRAKHLFYSFFEVEQEIACGFFHAIIARGTEEELNVIADFIRDGYDFANYDQVSLSHFFQLIEGLIAHADRFYSARTLVAQSLSKMCPEDHELVRKRVWPLFSTLLTESLDSVEEAAVADFAIESISLHFERSGMPSDEEFYGPAVWLLNDLIQVYLHKSSAAIQTVVYSLLTHSSSYLAEKGAKCDERIEAFFAKTKELLPDEATVKQLDALQESELLEKMKEKPEIFWAYFCKIARISYINKYDQVRFIKDGVQKLMPFFLKGASFIVSGELLVESLAGPISLKDLDERNFIHSPYHFKQFILPYVPGIARALGYGCSLAKTTFQVRKDLPSGRTDQYLEEGISCNLQSNQKK